MKHATLLLAGCLAAGFVAAGCQPTETGGPGHTLMGKCPGCGMEMEVGAYCAKCNAVASHGEMIHCDKCDRDVKAGTYCGKCNRFVMKGTGACPKCGAKGPMGSFCDQCKAYVGLPGVGWDEKTHKPCSRADVY